MNRKELKKAFDEGLLSKEEYGAKLVEIAEAPKNSPLLTLGNPAVELLPTMRLTAY